jgi:glycosyltransferase involved in cell wall biosynthesis
MEELGANAEKHILFVLPSFHTNLFYALKALSARSYGVSLLCERRRDGADDFIDTHTLLGQQAATLKDISSLFGQLRPDLVVIRKTGRLSQLAYRVGLLQRRNMVGYDQRPYLHPRHCGQIIHGVLKGRPMRRFTPVHGLRGRPDPRAAYIPFPVEPMPAGTSRDYAPSGSVRILCVAKLTERRKNHFLLLRALEPLASEFDFRVTFVGNSSLNIGNPDPPYFQALQDYAMHGFLSDRINIKLDVPFEHMTSIYQSHDICVLPSRAEPLGTAPLEAMGQGCAAIVSSDAGSAYYVQGAQEFGLPCGAVFESDNGKQLELELATLMADRDRLSFFGRNAAEWARREFSPELFAIRFHQFLDTPEKNK